MKNFRLFDIKLSNVYNLIKENIYSCVTEPIIIYDKKFHHRLEPKNVVSVLEYGLLSKRLKTQLVDNRELTEKEISIFSEEWHVNGLDFISLSNVEENCILMGENSEFWDAYCNFFPDIIVSSKVQATRNSTNYFNEYLVENQIPINLFNSIDLRILKIINIPNLSKRKKIKLLLDYYETIINIAKYLVDNNLSIPLRETSEVKNKDEYYKAITLDPNKIIKLPKLLK